MNAKPRSTFNYVSYIRTTPEKLWSALTTPEFMKQYWFGMNFECDWKAGSTWRMSFEDGRTADDGMIVESEPPKRLVIRWHNRWKPEMTAEGASLCTFDISTEGTATKLSITHTIDVADSQLIVGVSGGWPKVISNLKSLLENGAIALQDPYPNQSK
jgi:uncharacterized protein YndB with AHSA1/START domain